MRISRRFCTAAVALFALNVACEDAVEPIPPQSLSDPAAVSTGLAQIDSAFGSESGTLWTYRRANSEMMSPIGGTFPAALSTAQAMMAQRGPLLPDSVMGTTYECDTTAELRYIASARPGAPVNGARFIVYRTATLGSAPARPLVELGYVDFLDESYGGGRELRVRLRSTDGLVTYFEYMAAIVDLGNNDFTATVNGTVHNGPAGPAAKTLTVSASLDAGSGRTTQTSYTLAAPSLNVTFSDRIVNSGFPGTVEIDLRLTRPGEVVRLTGNLFPADSNEAVVTVNGGAYVRGSGDFFGMTWTKHDNSPLTDAERAALDDLHAAAGVLFFVTFEFENPIEAALDP